MPRTARQTLLAEPEMLFVSIGGATGDCGDDECGGKGGEDGLGYGTIRRPLSRH